MWSFFINNFRARRDNQSSGGFFIKTFYENGSQSLQEVKDVVAEGDNKWIDRISYFSHNVKGSSGYWRYKC